MKITVWSVLLVLSLGIFLFIMFRLDPRKSPKYRRIVSGVLGLTAGVSGYYGMVTGNSPLALSRSILIFLPVLGGLLLILSAFQTQFQDNIFEYLSWALLVSWVSPILLSWTSIRVQCISSLVIVLVVLIMQTIKHQSMTHWESSSATRR